MLKIGVNTRISKNNKTGIPVFIEGLYAKLIQIDKANQYYYLQNHNFNITARTNILNTPSGTLGDALYDLYLINKQIRDLKIDIFHGPSNIIPPTGSKRVKHLLTVHDLTFVVIPECYPRLFREYYKFAVSLSIKKSDRIIADSVSTKRDIEKSFKFNSNKIDVIYPGLKDIFLKPIKLSSKTTNDTILALSSHPLRKNTTGLVVAFATSKKLKDYTLLIAGGLSPNQKLIISDLVYKYRIQNRVRMLGYVSDEKLVTLYSQAAAFVYPSFYEGFGFPILEAMASGCPTIAGNNSSMIEIMPDKRWLADPYDYNDIKEKVETIVNLSETDRRELVNTNRTFAEKFTWDVAANSYLKIFNRL